MSELKIPVLKVIEQKRSRDGSRKFLFELADGNRVESVLIARRTPGRFTACLSSQVGCAMGCGFCQTGVQGFKRNLSTAEILAQAQAMREFGSVTGAVFMGMGEPLLNVDAVAGAAKGLGLSRRRVTISTSGIVPELKRLHEKTRVRLAVSLNAPTDVLRTKLMPVNRKWPIAELLEAAENYARISKMPVVYEYVLLKDVNDSLKEAEELYSLLSPLSGQLNLIPWNSLPNLPFERPDFSRAKAFQHYFVSRGFTATLRWSAGGDVGAACGQLYHRERPTTPPIPCPS